MSEASNNTATPESELQLIQSGQREAAELLESGAFPMPPPDAVPGYQIVGEIGRGGMGVVYKALQVSTKRVVALKVMVAGSFASRSARRRFQREVELAARFQHPGIVRVLESGHTSTGQQYYAMDYVDGVRLDRWVSDSQPDVGTRLRLFMQVCDAVDHAHGHGVVHRDLKPANVVVDADGDPHILDFGLSKATDQTSDEDKLSLVTSMPGQVIGTLCYLSPEQAAGTVAEIDARTDVYALGVMLFEALTGALPFATAGGPSDVLQRIREDPPTPPSSLSNRVDRELETVILKALAKEKPRRYQSAKELGEDIGRYLAGEPIRARRPSSLYVVRKMISRHRVVVALAATAVGLGLMGTWGGTYWRNRSLQQQRDRELAKARLIVLSLQRNLEVGRLRDSLGPARAAYEKYPELPEARLVWVQAQLREARRTRDDGPFRDAMLALRVELERHRARWAVLALLAEVTREPAQAEQLRAQASQALDEAPDTAETWYLLSLATLDINKALHHAQQTVKRDGRHALGWRRLAYLCRQKEDFAGALRAAQELIDLGEQRHEWVLFEAGVLARQRQYWKALEQFDQAIDLAPRKVNVYRRRAAVQLCLEQYQEAIDDYSSAIASDRQPTPWLRYYRATPLWIRGRLEEAAQDYRVVVRELGNASYAPARLFLVLQDRARGLQRDGKPVAAQKCRQEARNVLEAARRNIPQGWPGEILECLAGERTPRELADAADGANREHVCEAYYYAGEACLLKGQTDGARAWFQKCVETELVFDPDTDDPNPMNEYHLARWRLRQLARDHRAVSRPKK